MSTLIKPPPCIVVGCGRSASYIKKNVDGTLKYRNTCSKHHKVQNKFFKKEYCENVDGHLGFGKCTATIVSPRQLQVDHSDGDRYNNDPDNHKTYCANCHSEKTFRNNDHLKRYNIPVETTFDSIFEIIEGETNGR